MTPYDKYELSQIEQAYSDPAYGGTITIARVRQLMYMVEHDIVPDGTFSDAECGIWLDLRIMHV